MKPRLKIASAGTPSGGRMDLYRHDRDFYIDVDGQNLMHSRRHASEMELARLGGAHLIHRKAANVLIGGLGMGYTLRQALDMLNPQARIVVVELLDVVVTWNRQFLGELNGHPLADRRVCVETGDIIQRVSRAKGAFDAILLDIDNGPDALTDPHNDRLYGDHGIQRCHQALREQGCLAVWSAEANPAYEQRLLRSHFRVSRYRVPTAKGGKSRSCIIWVASKGDVRLPQGGLDLGRCHSS